MVELSCILFLSSIIMNWEIVPPWPWQTWMWGNASLAQYCKKNKKQWCIVVYAWALLLLFFFFTLIWKHASVDSIWNRHVEFFLNDIFVFTPVLSFKKYYCPNINQYKKTTRVILMTSSSYFLYYVCLDFFLYDQLEAGVRTTYVHAVMVRVGF